MQNRLSFTSSKKLLWLLIFLQLIAIIISLYSCGGSGGGSSSDNNPPAPAPAPPINTATLTWDSPTTNADGTPLTDLVGYKIYYGTTSGNYTEVIAVGNVTTYKVEGLQPGTYYFALTAYDTSGNESGYSNEVSKTIN